MVMVLSQPRCPTHRHDAPVVKACRLSMEGAQIHYLSSVVLSLPRRPTRRHGAQPVKVGNLLDLGISPSPLTSAPSGMLFSLLPLSLDDSAALGLDWISASFLSCCDLIVNYQLIVRGGACSPCLNLHVLKIMLLHIYYCCNFEVGLRFLTLPSFPPSPRLHIFHITP